jgi:uncharacterized protein YbjQ (UPF0145 family)
VITGHRRSHIIRGVLVVTTEAVAGHALRRVIGEVVGATIRSNNVYLEGVKSLTGFPNPRIRSLLARWRQDAVADMAASARRKGANAVVGMRFDHRDISQGWVEICAYGTAVVIVTDDRGRRPKRGRRQPNQYRGGEVRWWATT